MKGPLAMAGGLSVPLNYTANICIGVPKKNSGYDTDRSHYTAILSKS